MIRRGAERYWRNDALRNVNACRPPPTYLDSTFSQEDNTSIVRDDDDMISPASGSDSASGSKEKSGDSSSSTYLPALGLMNNLSAASQQRQRRSATRNKPSYLPKEISSRISGEKRKERWDVPFIWRNDLARGVLESLQVTLRYALM